MLDRLELIIGDKVEKIKKATVLLVGLGGVGGQAFEALLRSGAGKIIIVDSDKFDKTNLNRQLLSTNESIGKFKVDEAINRKNLINKNCNVVKINAFIDETNIDMLFKDKVDFVIDAIDTIRTKKLIIKNCLDKKIKFISVMGTGNKLHPEKLTITDIRKTSYDPLAKEIRKFINKEKIKEKVPVVFSKEIPIKTGKVGSTAFVPAAAGLIAVSYVINELIKEK